MSAGALIGRDVELAELEARARNNRMVSVIGPGGVGKTALANAVARRVADSFPLGVRHVDLTRVDDVRDVPGALAAQLGFDSFDALLSSPSDRPVLLVIDNCEHLLEPVATAILEVLGACRQPTVLATSRSPLELPGESVMSLAPLGVPATGDDAAASPSVQLFLQRCRDAGATVAAGDLATVAELCRRLDGLPLALEIAAARARTMSIPEIAARLTESVDVLDRPRFRGDPRHRSVSDTIRWSYDLLGGGAGELLEQLAVFAGAFRATTARAITPSADRDRFDARLDELVHASLVSVDTAAPETRYRLFDTVRRFALDQLSRRGELDATYDRFSDHVLASMRELLAGAAASWRPGLLRDLVDSYDDVAEAVRWCNRHDRDPHRALSLCSILWAIAHQGRADDIAALVRDTMECWPDRESSVAARAVAALATADYVTGHPRRAADLAEDMLAALSSPGLATVTLNRVLGQSRRALGDSDGALSALRTGAHVGRELGMTAMAMELEVAAAQVLADAGAVDAAIDALVAIVDQAVAVGSTLTEVWASTTLGWLRLRLDPRAALPLIETTLAHARRVDFPIAVAVNLRSLAFARLLLGESAAAVDAASELSADLMARGALSNARVLVDVAAALAHHAGHPAWETVAATARAMPVTTMASGAYELIPLPPTDAAPLARHDAVAAVNNLLAELADDTSAASRSPELAADITFRGREVSVRASKGLTDLIRLIEADGREIHCLELAGAGVEQSSTGELIDAVARRDYEERIRELQAEVEAAERDNDHGRVYRYQVELDTIIDHLTAALGRGGRTRRAADNAERARSAVTHRVRATIRQLARLNPTLGRHLGAAISTGMFCSYRPEHPTSWSID